VTNFITRHSILPEEATPYGKEGWTSKGAQPLRLSIKQGRLQASPLHGNMDVAVITITLRPVRDAKSF
jgi:hypothetical protein